TKENEDAIEVLSSVGIEGPSRDDLLKYKLWKQQNGYCVYSGQKISLDSLFRGDFQVDHVIPHSRSLDDSFNNKVVCIGEANRFKTNKTPYEAFLKSDLYNYDGIIELVQSLPKDKRNRFLKSASDEVEGINKWLARQLNDTAYISKIVREYLQSVCPKVWATNGRLTSTLRHYWGLSGVLSDKLNKRSDLRHHAVDAVIVGFTERNIIRNLSHASQGGGRFKISCPIEGLFEQTKDAIDSMNVSHRIDHSKQGRFLEETAYGAIFDLENPKKVLNLTTKIRFDAIRSWKIDKPEEKSKTLKKADFIVNPWIREQVKEGIESDDLDKSVDAIVAKTKSERTKTIRPTSNFRLIEHGPKNNSLYKFYNFGNNHCIQLYRLPKGSEPHMSELTFSMYYKEYKNNSKFSYYFQTATKFDAMTKNIEELRPHPAAKKLMTIHIGDILANNSEKLVVIALEASANRVKCRPISETKSETKKDYIPIGFKKILARNLRVVYQDELGRIKQSNCLYD
ncbi:hypothetical protein N9D31_04005, partial [Oligoflexaceae bacterium]|nr:hypothetical protein [Oligoflexaceae bacterium]